MSVNLDLKDKRILSELDLNARQPNSQIAKKVGLSKDSVGYRIKQLENKGILSGYRTIINLRKLGFVQYRVVLRLIDVNSKLFNDLISFLKREEPVWVIGKNEGEWDLAFVYVSKDTVDFYSFFERFNSKFRRLVKDKLITELLKYDELRRSYLGDNAPLVYKKSNLITDKVLVDDIDISILNILSIDARIKLIDLANKLELSSMLVHQRIKKLEKKRVIIDYKADINVLALGRDYYGIKINLSDYSEKEGILAKVHSFPTTTALIYSVGGYDIEFDVELLGTKEYHELIDLLRNEFSTIREIKSIRAIEYYLTKHSL